MTVTTNGTSSSGHIKRIINMSWVRGAVIAIVIGDNHGDLLFVCIVVTGPISCSSEKDSVSFWR